MRRTIWPVKHCLLPRFSFRGKSFLGHLQTTCFHEWKLTTHDYDHDSLVSSVNVRFDDGEHHTNVRHLHLC